MLKRTQIHFININQLSFNSTNFLGALSASFLKSEKTSR